MECKKCGVEMLCESIDEKRQRYRCTKCGLTEIVDEQGRKLLVDRSSQGTPLLG